MRVATITGFLLLAMILLLAAFNLRKRFPGLPLGSNAAWLRVHVWVGLLSVSCMLIHVDFAVPNGILEGMLAGLFTATVGTGVFGLFLSRTVPRRLTDRGEDYRFDDIPNVIGELRERAETLVRTQAKSEGGALAELYVGGVSTFMAKPQHFLHHWVESTSPLRVLVQRMEEQGRYMNVAERKSLAVLIELCREKFDLDYRYAQQSLLRWWLFLHVPLTYLLILFGVIHGFLAMSYGSH